MSKAIVINDVPEIKDEKTVRAILNLSWPVRASTWIFDCNNPHVISASQVRKEIKIRLEKDVELEKRKYDLILLCKSGGTILCGGFEDKLQKSWGDKIKILPYSRHDKNQRDAVAILSEEIKLLNERPSIAIVEGDAGENGSTSTKLKGMIRSIKKIRPDARIQLIIGAANTTSFEEYPIFKTIKFICCWKTKGHILRLSEVVPHVKKYLDAWHENKDARLKAGLVWPERDKCMGELEKILISHQLYPAPQTKEHRGILSSVFKWGS